VFSGNGRPCVQEGNNKHQTRELITSQLLQNETPKLNNTPVTGHKQLCVRNVGTRLLVAFPGIPPQRHGYKDTLMVKGTFWCANY